MNITSIELKNFRCFESLSLSLQSPVVVVEGLNGVGKTSLLEALHYACYLRSFRTYVPSELTRNGEGSFFIRIGVSENQLPSGYEIQIGFSGKRRLVKIDQQPIVSYKQLLDRYKVVTLTEDDLALIQDGPEIRRVLLDHFSVMLDPESLAESKKLKHIVDSRNALLKSGSFSNDSYLFWSEELWNITQTIRTRRQAVLAALQQKVNALLATSFSSPMHSAFIYQPKKELGDSYAAFEQLYPHLAHEEGILKRSLFGAHLDDFQITFQDKKSRVFASRGQQKMIVVLIKIAQIQLLLEKEPLKPIFLLDDFMTDFDPHKGTTLIDILISLGCQLIVTNPSTQGWLSEKLAALGSQQVRISN